MGKTFRRGSHRAVIMLLALIYGLALNLQQLPLAHAAGTTRLVTSTADSGPGSLRQAIADAAAGDTILLSTLPGSVLKLASQLEINKNLTIQGPNANVLTISGNNATRVFQIDMGATVTISQLTIAQGNASAAPKTQAGGGILNQGTLTLQYAVIRDSTSLEGGALQNDGPNSNLTLLASTLVNNNSASVGGGIRNEGAATITNSTITGNTATTAGGGISNNSHLTLTFSTIVNNRITGSGTGGEVGGGIASVVTFTPGQVVTTLQGDIVAGNSPGLTGRGPDVFEYVVSQGYNFIGNGVFSKGLPAGPGDQVGFPTTALLDPKLGALDTSGLFPTPTFLPQPGSPVIDKGGPTCPTNDQRYTSRPQGAACDIGAVEVPQKPAPLTLTPSALPNGSAGSSYSQQLTATGGTAPYTFALVSGALPNGMTFSASGLLSGTPAAAGTFTFMIKVTDSKGMSITQNYSLLVGPAQSAPAPPRQRVKPIVDCVADNSGGKLVAFFGYRNDNTVPVTIMVGANNFFTPAPQNQGQPSVFQPGRQQRVFSLPLNGASLTWTLIGPDGVTRTATATTNSQRCAKPLTVARAAAATLAVARAQAAASDPQLILDWTNDADDIGVTYNLLRATNPNGPWTQVNDNRLIPAGGHCPAVDSPSSGQVYYTIENVDPDGEITWFDATPVNGSSGTIGYSMYLPLTQH